MGGKSFARISVDYFGRYETENRFIFSYKNARSRAENIETNIPLIPELAIGWQ